MNTHAKIQNAMRHNEQELLAFLRRSERAGDPLTLTHGLGSAWHNALERLIKAGKVKYINRKWVGYYKAVKGARPVTPGVK